MGIFDKLFGKKNLTPLEKLKLETEKGYERIVKESAKSNPFANDPILGGMHSYQAILAAGKTFKCDFIVLTQNTGLTESDINNAIDEVQYKILKKHFTNFD